MRTAIAAAYVSAETVAASTAAAAKVSGSFVAADGELSALTFALYGETFAFLDMLAFDCGAVSAYFMRQTSSVGIEALAPLSGADRELSTAICVDWDVVTPGFMRKTRGFVMEALPPCPVSEAGSTGTLTFPREIPEPLGELFVGEFVRAISAIRAREEVPTASVACITARASPSSPVPASSSRARAKCL